MKSLIYVVDANHPRITVEEFSIELDGKTLIDGAFDDDAEGVIVVADEALGHEHYIPKSGFESRMSDFPSEDERDYCSGILTELEQVDTRLDGDPYRVFNVTK